MKKFVYYFYKEKQYRKATIKDIRKAKKIYKKCSTSSNKTEIFQADNPRTVVAVVGVLYFRFDDNTSNSWFEINNNSIRVNVKVFQKLMVRNDAVLSEIKRVSKLLSLKKLPDVKTKVTVIHDYLCNFDEYEYDKVAFTIFDALVSGKAICSGYSMAFKALCDYAGIECDYLESSKANHAWNRVLVNGQYLYLDSTWDDRGDSSKISRKYFLLTEDEFRKVHPWHETVNDGIWQI